MPPALNSRSRTPHASSSIDSGVIPVADRRQSIRATLTMRLRRRPTELACQCDIGERVPSRGRCALPNGDGLLLDANTLREFSLSEASLLSPLTEHPREVGYYSTSYTLNVCNDKHASVLTAIPLYNALWPRGFVLLVRIGKGLLGHLVENSEQCPIAALGSAATAMPLETRAERRAWPAERQLLEPTSSACPVVLGWQCISSK